jgi:hypothetical protein
MRQQLTTVGFQRQLTAAHTSYRTNAVCTGFSQEMCPVLPIISNGNSGGNQTETTTSNNHKHQHFIVYQLFGCITPNR